MVLRRPRKHFVEVKLDQAFSDKGNLPEGLNIQFIGKIVKSGHDGSNLALKVTDGYGEADILVSDFEKQLSEGSVVHVFAQVSGDEIQVIHLNPLEKFDFAAYCKISNT